MGFPSVFEPTGQPKIVVHPKSFLRHTPILPSTTREFYSFPESRIGRADRDFGVIGLPRHEHGPPFPLPQEREWGLEYESLAMSSFRQPTVTLVREGCFYVGSRAERRPPPAFHRSAFPHPCAPFFPATLGSGFYGAKAQPVRPDVSSKLPLPVDAVTPGDSRSSPRSAGVHSSSVVPCGSLLSPRSPRPFDTFPVLSLLS